MRRFTRKRGKAAISLAVAGLLLFTTLPVSGGLTKTMNVSAAESEVSVSEHTYTFSDNTGKTNPNVGEILEGTNTETTGILYYASDGSGLTFDPTQLKFRQGNVMYLPIQDDTTKITYTQTCSGSSATRPTYLFDKDSGYHVDMNTTAQSVTVSDITDYSKVINGQKYFGVISGGDVKITKITVTEYNPVNEVTVSGKVAQAVENGVTEILFKNMDDSSIPVVTAQIGQDGSYQTTLRRIEGKSNYAAILSKTGFKVDETNGANRFALTGNEGQAVEDFSVIPAETTSISGTVTGIPDNACKDTLKVILVPQDPVLSNVELNLTRIADGNYQFQKAILAPDQEYQVTLENADDYEVTQTIQKAAGNYDGVELMAAPKALQNVSGTFVTSDEKEADVKNVTFTNMDTPEYSYTFSVTGNQYQAQLRAGEYETSAEVDSYTVFDHVSVADQAVQNRIYLKAPQDTSAVAYQSEILVGEGQQYPTITKALDAVNRMTREDGQRVTIVLTDALYREQVVVDTPDITFKSKGDSPATITWYYGTNFSYYSADPSTDRTYGGLYSEQYAVDQYTKTNVGMVPGHWGSTVNIMAAATGFQADNVIFENSFNRYHTDEEVADGVGLGVDASKQDRSTASDDDVKKAVNKERACTMFLQADDCEFNNCSFLSGQDTMYTGDNTESSYFRNCTIEGTTDFICGAGNPVFDRCTLSMYGYSDKAAGGSIITASKPSGEAGYLFSGCSVVRTSYPGINTDFSGIFLGRPWGEGTKVLFFNTEVESADLIAASGYTPMSVTPDKANYVEYNTHTPDGTVVDLSARAKGVKLMTEQEAASVSVASYFDGWKPVYYYADYTQVDEALAKANALDPQQYVDFTGVTDAVSRVVRDKTADEQEIVDRMATDIENAMKALVKKESKIPTTDPTQPTTQPTTEPTTQPTTQPTTEPTTQPTTQPTTEPTTEPTTQPTTEPTQPTSEKATEKTTQQASEKATEQESQKATEMQSATAVQSKEDSETTNHNQNSGAAVAEQSQESGNATNTVQTGDTTMLYPWLLAILTGAAVMLAGFRVRKSKNR